MIFYKLVYGKNAYYYAACDSLLKPLKNVNSVLKSDFYSTFQKHEFFNDVITHLVDEHFITVNNWYVAITTKGKLFINDGGYKRIAIFRVISAISFILGLIASITAIITLF